MGITAKSRNWMLHIFEKGTLKNLAVWITLLKHYKIQYRLPIRPTYVHLQVRSVRSNSVFFNSKEGLECNWKKRKPDAQVLWETVSEVGTLSGKPFIWKKKGEISQLRESYTVEKWNVSKQVGLCATDLMIILKCLKVRLVANISSQCWTMS